MCQTPCDSSIDPAKIRRILVILSALVHICKSCQKPLSSVVVLAPPNYFGNFPFPTIDSELRTEISGSEFLDDVYLC